MRETLTIEQINQHITTVEQKGVEGAIQVYSELYEKNYAYAGWALGVALEEGKSGTAAIDYMNNVSLKKTGTIINGKQCNAW